MMRKQHFSIEIQAPRDRVWTTLFADKTFRDWANIIDEGQHMVGELKEGNKVQFISSRSGYGVTSLVEKLTLNAFVSFRQIADRGKREPEYEWTGGMERYSLAENDGVTTLTVDIDVPPGLEEMFQVRFPKALERVQVLAERRDKNLPQ